MRHNSIVISVPFNKEIKVPLPLLLGQSQDSIRIGNYNRVLGDNFRGAMGEPREVEALLVVTGAASCISRVRRSALQSSHFVAGYNISGWDPKHCSETGTPGEDGELLVNA